MLAALMGLIALSLPACDKMHAEEKENGHHEHQKIVLTSPLAKDVVITQEYVCQIHSRNHIEVCALQDGYLEKVLVKEGQAVKQGDVLFQIQPTLYQARLAGEKAKAQLMQIKFNNTKNLFEQKPTPVVSEQEVFQAQAELDEANAKVTLAQAELNFTTVRAPWDSIVDRLMKQQGSLIEKKDILTTLSDNGVMWVYFNVPEGRYLEYMADRDKDTQARQIQLVLADGSTFPQTGEISAIEAQFNNETGNIPFRADFANPTRVLRHGQTGNVLIHKTLKDAVVIPQRATYEVLDKRYVFVVGEDDVAHQRPITVLHEKDDIFIIKSGLEPKDKIVLEGVRQVHDGEKLKEPEFIKPEEALAHQKFHAE